jgi:hypothetical protein
MTTMMACSLTLNGPGFSLMVTRFSPPLASQGRTRLTCLSGTKRAQPRPSGLPGVSYL